MPADAAPTFERRNAATVPSARAELDVSRHMPALDGVRGLAVLMVLGFHFISAATPVNIAEKVVIRLASYGANGVELFFVLSGFLITGILYDARDKPNYFRNFYMRRALRIFPLYYGVLVLVFFVAPLIPLFQGAELNYLVDRQAWAWLYAINLYIAKEGTWSFSYLQHFWSLAVEEHFYLFWPFVVYLLVRRPRTLLAVSFAIAVAAMLSRLAGTQLGVSWWTTYVLTPCRLDGLAMGSFMAVMVRQPGGLERLVRALPLVVAVAGTALAGTYLWTVFKWEVARELILGFRALIILVLLACLLLWALVSPATTIVSRFFASRFMMFFGTYSYGLYVYHHFISYYMATHQTDVELARWLGTHSGAIVLQALLGALASLAIAYVSYEFYEKRFLRLKRHYPSAGER